MHSLSGKSGKTLSNYRNSDVLIQNMENAHKINVIR